MPRFWLSEDQNCTSAHFLGHIYSAFTLRHQSYSLRSYIKEFVEATQGEDLCLTESSLRAIGGQTCKMKHRNMSRNAINAKDSHQTYTNQEESLIPYPALDHLPSRAWILSVLSPKQQGTKDIYWLAQTISPNGLKLNP